MTQPDFDFKHTILARLDATIEQYEDTMKTMTNTLPNANMRKSKGILMQLRREILNVREEAVTTLKQLNTFGATLETMAHPEAGVTVVVADVLKWFWAKNFSWDFSPLQLPLYSRTIPPFGSFPRPRRPPNPTAIRLPSLL